MINTNQLNQQVNNHKLKDDLRIYEKAMIAGFAGGFAAFLTNPFELITIRKIYEGALPTA